MYKYELQGNKFLRLLRAFNRRFRGIIFILFRVINSSSYYVTFGKGARIIGSRNIFFNKNFSVGINSRIETHTLKDIPIIKFGENVSFGDNLHIGATSKIIISSGVLAGSNILIIDHNHGDVKNDLLTKSNIPPKKRIIVNTGDIFIGENVWIADNVVILGGTIVGEGSVISAGTIVKGHFNPYSLIRGNK